MRGIRRCLAMLAALAWFTGAASSAMAEVLFDRSGVMVSAEDVSGTQSVEQLAAAAGGGAGGVALDDVPFPQLSAGMLPSICVENATSRRVFGHGGCAYRCTGSNGTFMLNLYVQRWGGARKYFIYENRWDGSEISPQDAEELLAIYRRMEGELAEAERVQAFYRAPSPVNAQATQPMAMSADPAGQIGVGGIEAGAPLLLLERDGERMLLEAQVNGLPVRGYVDAALLDGQSAGSANSGARASLRALAEAQVLSGPGADYPVRGRVVEAEQVTLLYYDSDNFAYIEFYDAANGCASRGWLPVGCLADEAEEVGA